MAHSPAVWFEIYVQDMGRARRFYEAVLGAALSPLPSPDLEMWAFPTEKNRMGASGALVRMEGVKSGGNSTIVYFGSADCSLEAGRVPAAGGKVFKEKFSIGQYGFITLAFDTEGNMFGVHSMG